MEDNVIFAWYDLDFYSYLATRGIPDIGIFFLLLISYSHGVVSHNLRRFRVWSISFHLSLLLIERVRNRRLRYFSPFHMGDVASKCDSPSILTSSFVRGTSSNGLPTETYPSGFVRLFFILSKSKIYSHFPGKYNWVLANNTVFYIIACKCLDKNLCFVKIKDKRTKPGNCGNYSIMQRRSS